MEATLASPVSPSHTARGQRNGAKTTGPYGWTDRRRLPVDVSSFWHRLSSPRPVAVITQWTPVIDVQRRQIVFSSHPLAFNSF